MKRIFFWCIPFISLAFNSIVVAQIGEVAVPYSTTYQLGAITEYAAMPTFDKLKAAQESERTSRLKLKKFASNAK